MIGMLLEGEYSKDIRVRKEAESLIAAGIEVVVIEPWKKGAKREEIDGGVIVRRIGSNSTFKRKGIRDAFSALFHINWLYYFQLPKLIKEYKIEHLHVHDLPLAKTALLRSKNISGKLILDCHENYPELLETYFLTKKNFFVALKNKMLFTPKRWHRFERKIMPKMDHIIFVIEEMRDKFIERYGLDKAKVSVISNYEKKSFAEDATRLTENDFHFEEDVFYLLYAGGMGPMRGLESVVHAVDILKCRGEKVKFLMLGQGSPRYVGGLKELVAKKNLNEDVLFLGWCAFETVNYFMQKVNLNIIPHIKNNHTDFTIPHKLFQIFLSKRPILVSSCTPLKRFVADYDAGWVYEASNAEDLAEKVQLLMKATLEEIEQSTNNAFTIAMEKFNWELEGEKLVAFYESL
jgi:glycosyltransferase involved in cell wall biosynthesis